MDAATNFCYGTVTTAPVPAASGTSMEVTLLGGCVLPAAPWNAFVWLTGVGPLADNAEIVRVTNVVMAGAVATLTIVRAQESSSARTIVVGDQFGVGPTAKFVSDLIAELAAKSATLNDAGAGATLIANAATGQVKKVVAGANVTLTPAADGVTIDVAAPGTGDVVGPASSVDGRPALFDGITGKLLREAAAALGSAAFENTTAFDAAGSAAAAQAASDPVGSAAAAQAASTPVAVVPGTAPSAGQILVGNAGGTAYTPVSVSGDGTMSAAGALTLANGGLSAKKKTIVFVIDGAGATITTGTKKASALFPWAGTITKATLLADQSGSIVVDVWKDSYANYPPTDADSITASAPPTITTATKSEDSTLTGWTTSITAGDVLKCNVDSCTTIQFVTLILEILLT